jgi:hypothetical protein
MHRVGSPAAHVAAAKAIPRCPPRQPVRAHPKPGHTDSFTVATDNDDFNTPRSNLRHVHADVVLVQEAKNEHVRKLEPKRYGVHQNTHRKDQAGTAVAWNRDRVHATKSGYRMGVENHGRAMLNRWINFTDVTIDGQKVRMVSVHRPPARFKGLWPEFDRHLAAFVKSSKLPTIVGMDANQANPQHLAKLTGLRWVAPDRHSIDGFLVSDTVHVEHVRRLAKNSSDHHPVQARFHLGKKIHHR